MPGPTLVGINNVGPPIRIDSGFLVAEDGITLVSAADGDWLVLSLIHDSGFSTSIDSPTGWTQVFADTSTEMTIECWVYLWNTGDPQTWSMSASPSFGDRSMMLTVWRDVQATPTIFAAPHFLTASPATADEIIDAAIGPNDVALGLFGFHNSSINWAGASPSVSNTSTGVGAIAGGFGWHTVTAAGSAEEITVPSSGGTPNETVGAQLVLAGPPGRFPLRLFPRNDDLDGPRLAQFFDSASRSTRLGAGSYE